MGYVKALSSTMWKHGNCVGPPGDYNLDFFGRLDNADELELINEQDKVWHRASGIVVRGLRLAIPSEAPDGIELFELLRLIVPRRRLSFLATEEELRRRVPQDLPELLRLDEWRHPDLVEKERPSATESFRQLAHMNGCARSKTLRSTYGTEHTLEQLAGWRHVGVNH